MSEEVPELTDLATRIIQKVEEILELSRQADAVYAEFWNWMSRFGGPGQEGPQQTDFECRSCCYDLLGMIELAHSDDGLPPEHVSGRVEILAVAGDMERELVSVRINGIRALPEPHEPIEGWIWADPSELPPCAMEKWWEHHFFFELSEINLNDITVTNSVQSVIASGLGRAVANGNVDPESVERMIAQANADLAQGKSYSPALVALFAIAMADRQAFDGEERQNNWVGWEDDNIVPIIYFGEDGAFTSYGQVPGGGNL